MNHVADRLRDVTKLMHSSDLSELREELSYRSAKPKRASGAADEARAQSWRSQRHRASRQRQQPPPRRRG